MPYSSDKSSVPTTRKNDIISRLLVSTKTNLDKIAGQFVAQTTSQESEVSNFASNVIATKSCTHSSEKRTV